MRDPGWGVEEKVSMEVCSVPGAPGVPLLPTVSWESLNNTHARKGRHTFSVGMERSPW